MGFLPGGCDLVLTMIQYAGWLILFEYNSEKYSEVVTLPQRSSTRYSRLQAYDPFSDVDVPGGQILQFVCAVLS